MPTSLIEPHGGELVDLRVSAERAAAARAASRDWPSWELAPRQLCDLELLLSGGFSPLRGFLGREDYEAVCAQLRLAEGTLWPIPITLDVPEPVARGLDPGAPLALRDPEGAMLAVLHVTDVWEPDREAEAKAVFDTTDPVHPGVAHLQDRTHPWYVGGRIEGIQPPVHHDFRDLRRTPEAMRAEFTDRGWDRVVAFQTRNPLHRAHRELTLRAARDAAAKLLIHPVVGLTKPGDVDHYTRVRCYQALLDRYPDDTVLLSLLPLAMRMAGPREALWHALIRRNHGCTHLVVGRDHAGPGADGAGRPFYDPYAAQALLREHSDEAGVQMIPFRSVVYVPDRDTYVPEDEVPEGAQTWAISGTELRRRFAAGDELPAWFTFPEVAAELRRRHPARDRQGLTLFFTGLSGAGKSTVAGALLARLLEDGRRPVTLLDGDLVRKHLSSELGFSREHRDLNIRRIGFVASEIARNGGIAVCAPIAPYDATRREVREMVEPHGGFVLVHVATSLEVCEARDPKGLYAKARAGLIAEFTGVSDPYEPPTDAEVVLDSGSLPVEEAVDTIIAHLQTAGYLAPATAGAGV
ncbi:MAG: bifunctional sulfate adenylyltransferase/adenylylsulfate kinase [Nitriliruptorales bacterium]|nr:bifunctional sulfate adenylyltransferase/adenylylsulfate kinase [Nitriliruptorales bacterium]